MDDHPGKQRDHALHDLMLIAAKQKTHAEGNPDEKQHRRYRITPSLHGAWQVRGLVAEDHHAQHGEEERYLKEEFHIEKQFPRVVKKQQENQLTNRERKKLW